MNTGKTKKWDSLIRYPIFGTVIARAKCEEILASYSTMVKVFIY